MNLLSARKVAWEDLRQLSYLLIGPAYTMVGTPFENAGRMLKVVNGTDAVLRISFDGVRDKDIVLDGQSWIYDFGSNKADAAGALECPARLAVYVKMDDVYVPTAGKVHVVLMYGETK